MRWFAALSITFAASGCISDELEEPIETDEIGVADYVLDNQSDRALLVRFETADDAGQVFWAGPIAAGERVSFASDSRVGAVPTPSDTFAIVELADPSGPMLYSQDPIDDGLWSITELTLGHSEIALEIGEL